MTLALTLNVPTTMQVKYCDLVPSKHPEKFPAQVKFKGAVDGAEQIIYLDTPDVLRCLFAAGAINDIPPHEDQQTIPAKGFPLRLNKSELTFLRTQAPKEKKITLSINGATADMVREKPAAAALAAKANGNGEHKEKRAKLYIDAHRFALERIVPLYRDAAARHDAPELQLSATDVKEIAATIIISETRSGGY